MKEQSPIFIIFEHDQNMSADDAIAESGKYKIIHSFSWSGVVSASLLSSAYQQAMPDNDGSFEMNSFEELKNVGLSLIQELKAPEAFLISVQDYNIGIESTHELRNYRDMFRRYGHVVSNPDILKQTGGLLGRFFERGPGKK